MAGTGKVRCFRYHVVFQRIWRSARSDRPLRSVGRLISGVERTSVGLRGVPVEKFELDFDHVVEALAPFADVVVAAVTAVHFAGGLSPIRECRITEIMSLHSWRL